MLKVLSSVSSQHVISALASVIIGMADVFGKMALSLYRFTVALEGQWFAVGLNLASSIKDLQIIEHKDSSNILNETRDAVVTLQAVLEGKHDAAIEMTLNEYVVPKERWSALHKVVEGLAIMSMFDQSNLEMLEDTPDEWDPVDSDNNFI